MSASVSVPIGVVIAREDVDSPWCDYTWRALGVSLTLPSGVRWKELIREEGKVQYLAAAPPLELHRKETAAYLENISSEVPALYVVLREAEEGGSDDPAVEVHLVTASPFEAQDYLDSGEDIVERVAMPEELIALISDFVEEHHVEEQFRKRKRDEVDIAEHKFGQEPIFVLRERMTKVNRDDG